MIGKSILEVILTIIVSILIIYGGQYLWNNIITTYSTKKTKNLVDSQIQKYKKIIGEIQKNESSQQDAFLTEEEKKNMDDSLTEYVLSLGGTGGSPQHYPPGAQNIFKEFPTNNFVTENGKEPYYPKGRRGLEGEPVVPPSLDSNILWLTNLHTTDRLRERHVFYRSKYNLYVFL